MGKMRKLLSSLRFVTTRPNLLFLAVSLTLGLSADIQAGKEIVVHLPVENEINCQVFLAKLRPCDNAYQQKIDETLTYNLSHNGRTLLLPLDENLQYLAHQSNPEEAFQVHKWKTAKVRYVIVPKIVKQTLEVQLFDVHTATLKTLPPQDLTGDWVCDVRTVHKICDLIHELIFGIKGICSKRILYSYQPKVEPEKGLWHAEIWEMDYNGKNLRQITEENNYSISPSTYPVISGEKNNYHFMFVTYKQGQPRIYFASRQNPKGKPLVPLRGNQLLPTFSRKGDKIAFISDVGGKADLFIQSFTIDRGVLGKPMQVYSFPGAIQASPSFNPEGSKVAFVSDKSGTPRIYIIDVNEVARTRKIPEATLISKKNRDNTAPCWSPDGKKIAYSARVNGVRQIWIYDTESSEEWQLTVGLGDKENPSWAPDSFHLIYNTTSLTFDIYRINLAQRAPVKLTEGPGKKHYPIFEP